MSEKSIYNLVSTVLPPVLIGSSSSLQVTRIIIKTGFDRIRLLTVELVALERLENPYRLTMGEML